MRTQIAFVLLAASIGLAPQAWALGPDDTEVVLDKGNIELSIIDGTTLSVGAGTHLTIEHAKGPGEITRINVLKGQFRVSNIFHRHSGLVLIQVGNSAFELNRGTALISSTGTGPQATLLHGSSLGAQGATSRLTTPGMRLKIPSGDGAPVRERPNAASINEMMNRVSGRSRPSGVTVRGPGVQRRIANRQPAQQQDGARILQRSDIKALTDKVQGAGLPPKPVLPLSVQPPEARPLPLQPPVYPDMRPRRHDGQGQRPRRVGMGQRPRPYGQGPHPQHGGQGQAPRHSGLNGGNPRNPRPAPPHQSQPVPHP